MKTTFGICALILALLTGCGRESVTDLSTSLQETHGLQPGADVVWKGQVVGEVTAVEPAGSGIRVAVDLNDTYETHFHQGLAASAVGTADTPEQTRLNLYGGSDSGQPPLPSGASVPEALPHQTVSQNQIYLFLGGAAAIVVIVLLIKSIGFIVKLVIALSLVAGSLFYLKTVLQEHGRDLVPESVAAKVDQFLVEHEVPDQLDDWMETVKEDARLVADEASRLGKEHGKAFVDEITRRTEEKIQEVGQDSESGRKLRELADKLESIDE